MLISILYGELFECQIALSMENNLQNLSWYNQSHRGNLVEIETLQKAAETPR